MVPFGRTEGGYPLYLCRGYASGTITAGKFWAESGICYIPYNGGEVHLTTKAQVYTLPGSKKQTDDGAIYEALPINKTTLALDKESILAVAVPVGRKPNAVRCFGATADIQQDGHGKETSIGVVCEDDMNRAYFPYWGKEVTRNLGQYTLIQCNN
ncbi:unnamed protein product [Orchesella dallaii]|uniref:Uncharacterized protein n=1 Tax=Orchesella dallaii TaxID=48710 RepID=A0ABP1R5X4_9HEXA